MGREVCLRKKKRMIRKKKEMKKRVGKGDKKKDKNFGQTYSVVLKTSLYVSKKITICFHKNFLDYQQVFYNNYSNVF